MKRKTKNITLVLLTSAVILAGVSGCRQRNDQEKYYGASGTNSTPYYRTYSSGYYYHGIHGGGGLSAGRGNSGMISNIMGGSRAGASSGHTSGSSSSSGVSRGGFGSHGGSSGS